MTPVKKRLKQRKKKNKFTIINSLNQKDKETVIEFLKEKENKKKYKKKLSAS